MEPKTAARAIRILCMVFPFLGGRIKRRCQGKYTGVQTVVKYQKSLFEVVLGEISGDAIYFYRTYEPNLSSYLFNALKNVLLFIDIGANIGVYSVLAAKQVRRVFAIEPSPSVRSRLERNIQLNCLDNITICDYAITDKNCEVSFYENLRADNMGVGKVFPAGYPRENELKINVKSMTLDCFALSHGIIDSPCVIKIDIEGAELRAIVGGAQWLSQKNSPLLFIEVHPAEMEILGDSVKSLIYELRKMEFSLYDVAGFSEVTDSYANKRNHFQIVCTKPAHADYFAII